MLWPRSAYQKDQYADAGGVEMHASSDAGGSSSIRQTNAGPWSSVPVIAYPASWRAPYSVVSVAAQPRSTLPPQWEKSTTTMAPVVVEQLDTGSAAAGDAMPPATASPAATARPAIVRTAADATRGTRPSPAPSPDRLTSGRRTPCR